MNRRGFFVSGLGVLSGITLPINATPIVALKRAREDGFYISHYNCRCSVVPLVYGHRSTDVPIFDPRARQ